MQLIIGLDHAFLLFFSPFWRFLPPGKLLARQLKSHSNYFLHLRKWKWHIKHNNQCTLWLVFAHFIVARDHTVHCKHDATGILPRFNVLWKPLGQLQHCLKGKLRCSPVISFKKLSLNCLYEWGRYHTTGFYYLINQAFIDFTVMQTASRCLDTTQSLPLAFVSCVQSLVYSRL